MTHDWNDSAIRPPALWRRLVAALLRLMARALRALRTATSRHDHPPHDSPKSPDLWNFKPGFIDPYEEVIEQFTMIDSVPYRPGEHWAQVIERLQASAEPPYEAFEYQDELWIQRTSDINEPLVVSGRPGHRYFTIISTVRNFSWTGDGWEAVE